MEQQERDALVQDLAERLFDADEALQAAILLAVQLNKDTGELSHAMQVVALAFAGEKDVALMRYHLHRARTVIEKLSEG